jgi:hypothetical protein
MSRRDCPPGCGRCAEAARRARPWRRTQESSGMESAWRMLTHDPAWPQRETGEKR